MTLTRHQWIAQCAARYVEALGIDEVDALMCAAQCATAQDDENGCRASQWGEPSDIADEDIACWEPG